MPHHFHIFYLKFKCWIPLYIHRNISRPEDGRVALLKYFVFDCGIWNVALMLKRVSCSLSTPAAYSYKHNSLFHFTKILKLCLKKRDVSMWTGDTWLTLGSSCRLLQTQQLTSVFHNFPVPFPLNDFKLLKMYYTACSQLSKCLL